MRRAHTPAAAVPGAPVGDLERIAGTSAGRSFNFTLETLSLKPFMAILVVVCAVGWMHPDRALGQSADRGAARPPESGPAAGQAATAAPSVVYKPPLRGAPADRIGGGTRTFGIEELPQIMVLAPDHPGLTTHPRPTLYWYISRPTTLRVDFTLREEQTGVNVLTTTLPAPQNAGIQRISLAELDVELAVGRDYRWIVKVVVDPGRPSRDLLSAGMIRRIDGPRLPTDRIQEGDKLLAAAWYAGEGLWYDALEAIGQAVDAAPGDKLLRTVRASLLEQVGLCQAARFDMSH